ncbi:MAG: molybdopterin-synthase adenylyltransferase MoeB [Candidatus Eisenbacteria bacterium]|uniref:Molybdopterin-synthase adenylyltransferase MoeB n=1 Tax=Eiseniibacteriota bacterium TaxID=2212470 RepID=A0A538U8U4_UNCEI|nr:MAG: molybdopterin-synthase adenylyltransferase MoeB [Candidatus Eisenbacteria bacterium]
MTKIHIPTPLRPYAGRQAVVEVEAATAGEALAALVARHPALRPHLYDEQGTLRRYVNLFRNDEDVRHLEREATPLAAGDTLSIVPSIAGGAPDAAPPRPPKPEPPAWTTGADGLPPLSPDELKRYGRHLILPEVGLAGQRRLKAASVLIVGSGGLGSPLALYLAAAGVGRIGLVDFDRVDASNLQRQVLYGTGDVGRPKLEAARDRLASLNPGVRVDLHETRLTSANALEILAPYDVVADGTDNFPTRYLVNDACTLLGKPNAYGSIFRFEGQASVFDARVGPCYRCLYPDPPPPGLVPSCAEGGVLGVLPGVVGLIQGIETLKLLLGLGETLVGRLILFDALAMTFRELALRKDPDCPLCGTHPTITALVDYEAFCGLTPVEQADAAAREWEIGPRELADRLAQGGITLIDVREPHEFEIARIPGATLIPLNTLPAHLGELDTSREVVLHCHHGQRSMRALEFLRQSGFRKLKNLRGGIDAWSKDVDPSVPRY